MNFGVLASIRAAVVSARSQSRSVSCFLRAEGCVHVAVDRVVERRHIGGALDRGVAPERHDAGARTADIAQEELEQRAAADGLRAIRVLGPGHRVRERRGAVAPGVGQDGVGNLQEGLLRAAGDALHHLGGVAAEVPPHDLEYRPRMLERLVARRERREQGPHQRVERRPGRRQRRRAAGLRRRVLPRCPDRTGRRTRRAAIP